MKNTRLFDRHGIKSLGFILLVVILVQTACSINLGNSSTQPPTEKQENTADISAQVEAEVAATQAALNMEGTQMALQQTQTAIAMPPPATAEVIRDTPMPIPTDTAEPPAITETPGEKDYAEKIKKAKILLYEDTNELGIGQWIEETLNRMGLEYTSTLDYSGDFMKHLNSGEKWDLIIVGAENHEAIQGEFWTALLDQSRKKVGVIAEVWYIDLYGGGKMRDFMGECGISYESNWDLAESIYWVKPDHELFNFPNTALPLLHYNRYWSTNAGDKVRLRSTGDAEILAGISKSSSKNGGLITTCMEGRTVFQSFSNHDFRKNEVMDLWENYITYTLTNHFKALEAQ